MIPDPVGWMLLGVGLYLLVKGVAEVISNWINKRAVRRAASADPRVFASTERPTTISDKKESD